MTTDGTTTLCPLDPTLDFAPLTLEFSSTLPAEWATPPEPEPGDPDTAYEPVVLSSLGRRLQLLLAEPITHRPLCEVRSFRCDTFSYRHGAAGDVAGTVSTWDPAWLAQGVATGRHEHHGTDRARPDLKGLEWMLVEDGDLVSAGIFQETTTINRDRTPIRGRTWEALFDERPIGATEQQDFLDGRGSFPTASTSGWVFPSGVEWEWNTTDPWEGDRSLRLRNNGSAGQWVLSPAVNLPGQNGWVRHPVGSVIVRSTSAAANVTVATFVNLGGTQVRPDFTLTEAGTASEDETDWQGPITSRGWLTPSPVDHQVRVGVFVPAGAGWIDTDLWRIQWPTLTGYVTPQDLSLYPVRIVRDAQYRDGGSPWGMSWTVRSLTGSPLRQSWAHQDDHPVGEAIRSIVERVDGPDVWVSPGCEMQVAARRGRDRRDVSLAGWPTRSVVPSFDPGAEVDELRALTGIGSGPARVVHGVGQPRRNNRRRIRTLVQTPQGLTYDAGRAWAQGEGEWAARAKIAAEVDVPYDYGKKLQVGDGVLASLGDGRIGAQVAVRVAGLTFRPAANRCTVSVGLDPVVAL